MKKIGAALCAVEDLHIIITGGLGYTVEKTVFRYEIISDSWVIDPCLNEARVFHASCSMNDVVYVFCGCNTSIQTINSIERLGLLGGSWRLIQISD